MKIAAQLYTVRDYCKDWEGISASLERVASMGYQAIQVSGLGSFESALLRKKADELGLEICATHTPYGRILEETDKVIEEHKLYGAKYIGLGYFDLSTLENCQRFLKEIMPAAEKIHSAGLKFVYHNHAAEFKRLENGKFPMDYILENTPAEIFGLLPDLYWLQFGGQNPVDFVAENKDRIKVVHLKDMEIVDNSKVTFAEIFQGSMDYDRIIKACFELGVEYAAVEQDVCPGDPFDSLKKSIDNIKAHCPYLL